MLTADFTALADYLDEGVATLVLQAMETLAVLMVVPAYSIHTLSCNHYVPAVEGPILRGIVISTRPIVRIVDSPFFEFAWQSFPSFEIKHRALFLVLFRLCNRLPL